VPSARRIRRSRRLAAGLALLAASAVLVLAAACGGGGSGSDDSGSGSAAGNGQNGLTAYAECMSKNGVKLNLPSGGAFPRRSGQPTARQSGAPDGAPGGAMPSGAPGGGPGGAMPSGGPGGAVPGGGGFGRPEGVDDATWQKAQQACQSVMPSFGPGGGQRNNAAFTAYRNCLSDHGVTLQGGPQDLNTTDPKTAAAVKACEALRPTARPTGAPSPTS
jgi:hypothetical protein